MLHDSPRVVAGSKISSELVDSTQRGTAFPADPTNSQLFQLTEQLDDNAPGIYVYSVTATKWVMNDDTERHPYDIAMTVWGRPMSYRPIAKIISPRTFIIDNGMVKCKAVCEEASSERTDFSVKTIAGGITTEIGTLTFMPGEFDGAFTSSLGHDILVLDGEQLFLINEGDRDGSLRDLAITFVGHLATL